MPVTWSTVATLVTVMAGLWVIVVTTGSSIVAFTATPSGSYPTTLAVFDTPPASIAGWVIVNVAV